MKKEEYKSHTVDLFFPSKIKTSKNSPSTSTTNETDFYYTKIIHPLSYDKFTLKNLIILFFLFCYGEMKTNCIKGTVALGNSDWPWLHIQLW